MNKTLIYETIAESIIKKPLLSFRTKKECAKVVRDIINMYKEMEMKQKILDDGVFKVKRPSYKI